MVPFSIRRINQSNQDQNNTDRVGLTREGKRYLSPISQWIERWFCSSNAKDIGTLYFIFALLAGLVGTAFSVLIRLELSGPGVQFIADNQLYNSIITAHAIVMIFFMVKLNANMFKEKETNINDIIIGNDNSDKTFQCSTQKQPNEFEQKYLKVLIKDPYNNRDMILKLTKKAKRCLCLGNFRW